MNRTLVIGGTGNVGRHVVSQLSATGARVRILSRNSQATGFPPNVESAFGDLARPETIDASLAGIDRVFLVWCAPPDTVEAVVEKIAKHARRVVFLSSPYKVPHPFFQRPQPNAVSALHAEIERLILASELESVFLRPGMFAANARFWWAPQIRAGGVVRWPFASAPTAPIDERDIAAVAVRALSGDGHRGAEYVLTGPQSLSQSEQVSAIGRVLGRSLRIEEISPDEARTELLTLMPLFIINMLLDAWAGAMGQPAFITSTVPDVTGRPARTFFEWARDHAAEFQAA